MAEAALSRRFSVRARLLTITLFPTLVVLPLFLAITALNWANRFDELLIAKVNSELTIANQYLNSILENSGLRLEALGASQRFAEVTASGSDAAVRALLDLRRAELGFDFLYMVESDGRILSSPPVATPADVDRWPVVQEALNGRRDTRIDVFNQTELGFFSTDLARQARLELVPTRAAVPTDRTEETRGMIVHAAVPVAGGGGPAALVGGILLNRNLEFIDTINALVYPSESLTEGSQGTATLFLEDVRVSTNVRLFQDVRALGTRVSAVVRHAVLDEGNVWLDRAFVVNDWYISAYEPIIDSFGQRVGMLYVGFLDTPFQQAKRATLWLFAGVFLLIAVLSVPVLLRLARGIFSPLEAMVGAINEVEDGDLSARTGVPPNGDEIGRVAQNLDQLLDQMQDREEELSRRVDARTRELREANQRLEATTKQLIVTEKLAAVGEIAAGVAHEINNPMAVIQGNVDVIRDEIGEASTPLDLEFKLIDEQIHSVSVIVSKLLQFTRPEEYADSGEVHPPDQIVQDSMPLIQHLLNKVAITPDLQLTATRSVTMPRTELQQVLINLMVNAIHAMPDGGVLTVVTADEDRSDRRGVRFEVADTGAGMPPEVAARAFDPFFTTKQGEGSGLGLSISRTLVERQDGSIKVAETSPEGTRFEVWLPAAEEGAQGANNPA